MPPNVRPSAEKLRVEIRVARRAEREPLLFAIDDQPDGDALDAAGAQAGLDLLPQHRRQRVAVEAIEDAAAFLRAHQVVVDVVRLLDRLVDGLLGDLVEDDPLDRNLRLQHLEQVPADRLALAVGVGGQHET